MKQTHILIVDDDLRLRQLLGQYLSENHFFVTESANATEAEALIRMLNFDLVVMDVMMPGKSGIDLLKSMRQSGNKTPVLMLTAMGDTDNRIRGLETGADDYLSKPFEPRELILRINNILKRTATQPETDEVLFGDCSFQVKSGALLRAGKPVALTGMETDLLRFLVGRAGQVVPRAELQTLMDTDNDRTVDVQITRLRKKVEADGVQPMCIQTVRGQGYKLVTK